MCKTVSCASPAKPKASSSHLLHHSAPVSGGHPCACQCLCACFLLAASLKDQYCPLFTDEDGEAQISQTTYPRSHSWDQNPGPSNCKVSVLSTKPTAAGKVIGALPREQNLIKTGLSFNQQAGKVSRSQEEWWPKLMRSSNQQGQTGTCPALWPLSCTV